MPDYRHVDRQRYCSKPPCTQASKADSQRRWLQKPDNHDHFRGPTMSNGCSYGDKSIRAIGDAQRRRPLRRPLRYKRPARHKLFHLNPLARI